jgi:hypothetical protein
MGEDDTLLRWVITTGALAERYRNQLHYAVLAL